MEAIRTGAAVSVYWDKDILFNNDVTFNECQTLRRLARNT